MKMERWAAAVVVSCFACGARAVAAQDGAKPGGPARAPAPARAPGTNIFDLGKERAQRIVVTFGEELPDVDELSSPMLRELAGVAADLKGKAIEELRVCVPPNPMIGNTRGAERVCTVHVTGRKDRKRVNVLRESDGNYVAVEAEGADGAAAGARAELKKEPFAALAAGWGAYRGPYDVAAVKEKRGEVFELEKPYIPGKATIDQATLSARFNGGKKVTIDGSSRDLESEKFFVRLPKGYDPRHPAGLLVWIDAGPEGRPPPPFNAALDELNIVCIGAADSGNNRIVSTRYQLALDAVATAEKRFHVDSRRVYVTGISGGGRVSSILQGCFPEVFTGAVPIVGLCFYTNVPTGTGRFWPAGFARPKADLFALLKMRRLAPITGRRDFNELEIQQAVELYQRDGLQAKIYDDPKMGHELPRPELFSEALKWVDEPWRKTREAEVASAKQALDEAMSKVGEKGSVPEAMRKQLVKVTELGPWTEEAWKAVEALKR